jgi:hypothetical protein
VIFAAAAAEEDPIGIRQVVVEPHAEQMAHRNARLGTLEVVAGGLLAVLNQVLIRRRNGLRIDPEQFVLVTPVRVEDPVAGMTLLGNGSRMTRLGFAGSARAVNGS